MFKKMTMANEIFGDVNYPSVNGVGFLTSIKIRAMQGTFNGQKYFNGMVGVSLLKNMKEGVLLPEGCNMIFIEDDNFTWDEAFSILRIKDIAKLEYLLFTGDLDLANNDEELPFVFCNKKQRDTLFFR